MSSNTITVNPRKKSGRASSASAQSANQTKGTVLLRTPLPKYSFEQKPKKKTDEIKDKSSEKVFKQSDKKEKSFSKENLDGAANKEMHPSLVATTMAATDIPIDTFQIGTIVTTFPQSLITSSALQQIKTDGSIINTGLQQNIEQTQGTVNGIKDKPVNKVGPISKSTDHKLTHSVSDSVLGVQSFNESVDLQNPAGRVDLTVTAGGVIFESSDHGSENQTGFDSEPEDVDTEAVTQSTGTGSQCSGNCKHKEKVKHLEEEKQMLKNQLEVQLQVRSCRQID